MPGPRWSAASTLACSTETRCATWTSSSALPSVIAFLSTCICTSAGALGVFTVDLVIERIRALDTAGRVTVSHGYQLGGADDAVTCRLIAEFAELDVSMTTVAPAQHASLPLAQLAAARIRVGLGQGGQRDYWSPYGNGATRGGASILNRDVPRPSGVHDGPGVRSATKGHCSSCRETA